MNSKDFYDWLAERVADGGNAALEEVAQFARDDDWFETQIPSTAALMCWGEMGCRAITANAADNPTVKTVASGVLSLVTAAVGSISRGSMLEHQDHRILAAINAAISNQSLRAISRASLQDLLQSIDTSDLLIPLSVAFQWTSATSGGEVAELVRAMSWHWLKIGPAAVRAFEELIATESGNEPAFQKFFCAHPQFLDPLALEVWCEPDLSGLYCPDFLIRRTDDSYLIVEIECPAKSITTQAGQMSEQATHAEKQVTDYRAFLDERMAQTRQHFSNYSSGDCLVVIGLEASLNQTQRKGLDNANAARRNTRIMGFDRIAQRVSSIAENISTADKIKVIERYRYV